MSGTRLEGVEVVFLDVGDTMVRAHPSWAQIYFSIFPQYGIAASLEELEAALSDGMQTPEWDAEGPFEATAEASFARIKQFDQAVLASLGYPDLPDEFFVDLEAAFDKRGAWHIFPDVLPAVEAMRDAGLRLGVISNWLWSGPDLLHTLELAPHFEHLVISARVGYNKPAPGIFEQALRLMDVAPERAIHVGDSPRADALGARAVGIQPVLIRRRPDTHGHRRDDLPDDIPVVSDLFGLLDLLGVARPAVAGVS